jgi:hypothetical protein
MESVSILLVGPRDGNQAHYSTGRGPEEAGIWLLSRLRDKKMEELEGGFKFQGQRLNDGAGAQRLPGV